MISGNDIQVQKEREKFTVVCPRLPDNFKFCYFNDEVKNKSKSERASTIIVTAGGLKSGVKLVLKVVCH